jgi:hypothetical protein
MAKGQHDHSEPQSIDMLQKLGYESSDVSLSVLVKWIAFLFLFIGGTSLLTLLIYWVFVPSTPVDQSSASTVGKLPPGVPALQVHPKIDMKKFWSEEQAKANGYGWVSKEKETVHIPVDLALETIASAGVLPKADPGAGKIAPARGEDMPGVAPNPATPGGGASQGPAAGTQIPGMPNQTVPGAHSEGPQAPVNPDFTPQRRQDRP